MFTITIISNTDTLQLSVQQENSSMFCFGPLLPKTGVGAVDEP